MKKDQLHICRKCKTEHSSEEEKKRVPDPSFSGAEVHVCKSCGCDTFYLKLCKFFPRPNGISFSKIVIKKIVKNRAYVAEFILRTNRNGMDLFAETTVGGKSAEEALEKTEKFLETKLRPSEFLMACI